MGRFLRDGLKFLSGRGVSVFKEDEYLSDHTAAWATTELLKDEVYPSGPGPILHRRSYVCCLSSPRLLPSGPGLKGVLLAASRPVPSSPLTTTCRGQPADHTPALVLAAIHRSPSFPDGFSSEDLVSLMTTASHCQLPTLGNLA